MPRIIRCKNCGEMKEHHAKGLCLKCYMKSTPTNRENARKYYWKHRDHYIALGKKYHSQHPERYREYNRRYHLSHREREWAKATLRHHRNFGYVIKISIDELEQIAKRIKHCVICGVVLKREIGKTSTRSPTLDRTNNGKIISKQTIQILCYRCNLSKSDRTMTEFIKYCKMVAKKYRGKKH